MGRGSWAGSVPSAHLILAGTAVEDGAGGGQGATLTTITPPPKIKGWLREDVGSLEDWAGAAQASLHTEAAKLRKVTITVQQDSGLAHMSRSDDPLLTTCPWRRNLWR